MDPLSDVRRAGRAPDATGATDVGGAPGATGAPGSAPAPRCDRLRELGRGATSRVYLARLRENLAELPAGADVALKVLEPEAAARRGALEALRAEAQAAASVQHASVVRVLWAGELAECGGEARALGLIQRFVPGRSLREILAQDRTAAEPLARRIGAELAGALAALHGAGIVHGDLKPDNVRLDADGRAVLLDLGFAQRLADAERGRGPNPGSIAYLSPERAQGAPASTASDVFALGVLLYELATGRHPFAPDRLGAPERRGRSMPAAPGSSGLLLARAIDEFGADQLLASIARARAAPPSRVAPRLSPLFDRLLAELLAREPRLRPDARELERRLVGGEESAWWRGLPPESAQASVDPLAAAHLTPIVGRAAELAAILAFYAGARAGRRGGAAWLVGGPGSGKSRLVSEAAGRARRGEDPPTYLYARCSEQAESRPGGPLLALLHRWLELPWGSSPGARERGRLERLVPPRELATLLQALDHGAESPPPGSFSIAVSVWLTALARSQATLVFVDDVQFAGAHTVAALRRLAERLAGSGLALVLGLRGEGRGAANDELALLRQRLELAAAQPAGPRTAVIELVPLTEEDIQELVTATFHHSVPRLRLARVLWLRTRGNPGMVSELLRWLIARGKAHPYAAGDARLVLDLAPEKLPLPDSLEHTIQTRFRALAAQERLWLGRLAVVGGRIVPEFLERAFPPVSRAELDLVLASLVGSGWLAPAGARYRFARPALREAVYRSLSEDRRRRVHAAAARALAPAEGQGLALEDAFQRAFHLHAAHGHDELLGLVMPLARRLAGHGQAQRLLTLADWGLAALDAAGAAGAVGAVGAVGRATRSRADERLELLEIAADCANRLGLRERERSLLDQLAELAPDAEREPARAARIYLLHARYAVGTGQYGLARGMLQNAVELARAARKDVLLSESLRRLALVQAHVGDLAESRALARRAEASAQGLVQRELAVLALALIDLIDERVEDALERVDAALHALRRGQEPGQLVALAVGHTLRARIWRSAGNPLRALAAATRAREFAAQAGDRRLEVEALARMGGLSLDLDRGTEAESLLREALLAAREIEDRRGETLAGLWLGMLLWERGDGEARATLERAEAMAHETGLNRARALALAGLARVDRAEGRHGPALERSERALELVLRHGAELVDRVVVVGTRALVLGSAGRAGEARDLAAELRRRVHGDARAVTDGDLRRGLALYTRRLLDAVLSPDGPVFPRLGAAARGASSSAPARASAGAAQPVVPPVIIETESQDSA